MASRCYDGSEEREVVISAVADVLPLGKPAQESKISDPSQTDSSIIKLASSINQGYRVARAWMIDWGEVG